MSEALFGLSTKYEDAHIVVIPVPWEVTTSYGSGASLGPEAILKASPQLDLYSYDKDNKIKKSPIFFLSIDKTLKNKNLEMKKLSQDIIATLDKGESLSPQQHNNLNAINGESESVNTYVYTQAQKIMEDGKTPVVVGGDHSSPYGLIKLLSEKQEAYEILHIDAHLDLRDSYQGFKHSHASIMKNVLGLNNPPKNITSIGIRDFCEEEMNIVKSNKLNCLTDFELANQLFAGKSFQACIQEHLSVIKHPVYISFDIDGLSPDFCPNTGTPVAGGLSFNQALFVLNWVKQHHKVIGFDLCEVSPSPDLNDEWDGNVGARILFNLCSTLF